VTPEEAALSTVLGLLDELDIPYMLTGSVAASYHGRPRATHDTDLVVAPQPLQLEALVEQLIGANFYVDADRAREALRTHRQFNIIDTRHACKIDLIIRKERPFSREEFARRQSVDLALGRPVSIVTPEDAVLSKLEWARRAGDSERQLADAAGVVAVNPTLDRAYIERWAEQLGVADLWSRLAAGAPDHDPDLG
jgi:hypothetical protein